MAVDQPTSVCCLSFAVLLFCSIALCSHCPEPCDCYKDWDANLTANCTRRHLVLLPEFESAITQLDISYNNIETLKDLWNSSGYLMLKVFWADAARIQYIHTGTFNYMVQVTKLFLRYNFIESLQHGMFQGLERLEELRLEGNRLQEINAGVFQNLKGIGELYLDNNLVGNVNSGAFDGLDNLKILSLAKNFIAHLEPNVFRGLRRLVDLRLHRNHLRTLDPNLFCALENLRGLRVDYNKIEEIAPGTFTDLKDLVSLNINGNFLRHFHHYYINKMAAMDNQSQSPTLSTLSRLVYLHVSDNLLEQLEPVAFKHLTNLKFLDVSRNRLSSLHEDTFIHNALLTDLRLSNNQNLQVPKEMPFINVKSLRNLHLSGCRISNLCERTFECLPNLQDVRLHLNSLQTLRVDTLVSLKNLSQISLYGNPLQCTCELKETWHWCRNMSIHLIHQDPLCIGPRNIPRKSWDFLESLKCLNYSEGVFLKSFHSFVEPLAFSFILLSGAVGTIALLLIFGSYERIIEIPNVFIFNIVVGQFIMIMVFLPVSFISVFTQVWKFRFFYLCEILRFTRRLAIGVSAFSVMPLAYHSYTLTVLSVRTQNCGFGSSSKAAILHLVVIWIMSTSFAFSTFLFATNDHDKFSYAPVSYCLYVIPYVTLLELLIYVLIPLCFITVVYVITERYVMLRSRSIGGKIDGQKLDIRKQLSKVVVRLTCLLFISHAPDMIMRLLVGLALVNQYSNVTEVFIFLTNCLFYSSTWLNPLAIYYTCRTYRNDLKHIIFCEQFRKRSVKPIETSSCASATEQPSSVAEISF